MSGLFGHHILDRGLKVRATVKTCFQEILDTISADVIATACHMFRSHTGVDLLLAGPSPWMFLFPPVVEASPRFSEFMGRNLKYEETRFICDSVKKHNCNGGISMDSDLTRRQYPTGR